MEEYIMQRIVEIENEYAQLPQLNHFDLCIEAVVSGKDAHLGWCGDVKVTLKHQTADHTIERVIGRNEDLSFISDTFGYPDVFTPRSKDICLDGLEKAYFNELGRLVLKRANTTEVFKVRADQRDKVREILKHKLGKLFVG